MRTPAHEIKPEDCPEPYWHETHRYCPACSWTDRPMTPADPVDGDDRKAAIVTDAIKWAEGDGYAILGDRFEFSELNVYRFVGDPRDILVDAYLALVGLTPTQPDRDQIELAVHQALMPEMMSLSLAIGSQEHYNELLARISGAVSALFNGGTNG